MRQTEQMESSMKIGIRNVSIQDGKNSIFQFTKLLELVQLDDTWTDSFKEPVPQQFPVYPRHQEVLLLSLARHPRFKNRDTFKD